MPRDAPVTTATLPSSRRSPTNLRLHRRPPVDGRRRGHEELERLRDREGRRQRERLVDHVDAGATRGDDIAGDESPSTELDGA